jgi:hypothetical protein
MDRSKWIVLTQKAIKEIVKSHWDSVVSDAVNLIPKDGHTSDDDEEEATAKPGWHCPSCKNVYGPHIDKCPQCVTETGAQHPATKPLQTE